MDYSKLAVIIENSSQRRKLCSAMKKKEGYKVVVLDNPVEYPICYTFTETDMKVFVMIPENADNTIKKGEKSILPLAVFLNMLGGKQQ